MTTTPAAASAVPASAVPTAPASAALAVPGLPRAELRYYRLARADLRHRWWRPLLVGLVGLGLYAALTTVVIVPLAIVGVVRPEFAAMLDRAFTAFDMTEPVGLAVMLLLIALMLPAILLAARLLGSRPVGLLSSVAGRLRWRWMATAFLVALAVHVPALTLAFGLEAVTGDLVVRDVDPSRIVALLAVILLIVPFQAAAEEYVFRGYLMQALGAWLRHPAFAILLPVPLFVLGHDYGVYGAIDVGLFAVMCGWLAWRTGGLEAPIAAHVVNNVALMAVNAVGIGDPNASDGTPVGLAISIVTMAIFTVVVTRRADRLGVASLRAV